MHPSNVLLAPVAAALLGGSCQLQSDRYVPRHALAEGVHLIGADDIDGVVYAPDGTLWVVRSGETLLAERFQRDAEGVPRSIEQFEVACDNAEGKWFSDDVWSLAARGDLVVLGGGSDAAIVWGGGGGGEVGRLRIEDGGPIHSMVCSVGWSGNRIIAYLDRGLMAAFDTETREVSQLQRDEGFRYATFDETADLMLIPWGEGKDAVVRRTHDFSIVTRLQAPFQERLYAAFSNRLGLAVMGRSGYTDGHFWLWPWKTNAGAATTDSAHGRRPIAFKFAHERGMLAVVWEREGVEVFDVADPTAPRSVAFHPLPYGWVAQDRTSDPYLTVSPDGREAALPVWSNTELDTTGARCGVWLIQLD